MARFKQWGPRKVGCYYTEYWPYSYNRVGQDPSSGRYQPVKPEHRDQRVMVKTGEEWDRTYSATYPKDVFSYLDTDDEIAAADMTMANSSPYARREQAAVLEHLGYGGPVSGGEARALKRLFTELGKPDLIKLGWANRAIEVNRQPTARMVRRATLWGNPIPSVQRVTTVRLQHCYLFKSPIEGIPFEKFVKLARMYKDDSGQLRKAVMAVLDNPDAHKEIETLDTLEILGNMTGI